MFIVGSMVVGAIVCGIGTYVIERNFKDTLIYSYYSVFFDRNGKPIIKNGEYMIRRHSNAVVDAITIFPHPAGMTTYQTDSGPTDPYNTYQNKRNDNITIQKGATSFGIYFSDGEREIDFTTKQGNWYEYWKISTKDNGDVQETIKIFDALPNGNILYEDSLVNGISTRQRDFGILGSLIRAVS